MFYICAALRIRAPSRTGVTLTNTLTQRSMVVNAYTSDGYSISLLRLECGVLDRGKDSELER